MTRDPHPDDTSGESVEEPVDRHHAPASRTTRRRFVLAGVTAITAGLAGCAGLIDDESDGAGGTGDGGDDGSGDGDGEGDSPTIRNDEYDGSLAYEVTSAESEYGGRFDGDNSYSRIGRGDDAVETYVVDGTEYFVQGDRCVIGQQGQDATDQVPVDPRAPNIDDEGRGFVHQGTDTIDGDSVDVYEIRIDTTGETFARIYLLEERDLIRRIEWENEELTMDIRYDDVEPVIEPDMDCQEPEQP